MADGNHLVVFVQGQHYVIGPDGHADLTQPVVWTGQGYRPKTDTDTIPHNDLHFKQDVELEPGAE